MRPRGPAFNGALLGFPKGSPGPRPRTFIWTSTEVQSDDRGRRWAGAPAAGADQPSSTEGLRASLFVARRQWNHQATASPIPRSRAEPTPTVIHSRSTHSR